MITSCATTSKNPLQKESKHQLLNTYGPQIMKTSAQELKTESKVHN